MKIRVIGGETPDCMVSYKRACKLVAKGMAEPIDPTTIQIVRRAAAIASAEDARSRSSTAGSDAASSSMRHSPNLPRVIEAPVEILAGQTFLHYPQRGQWTRWVMDRRGHRVRRAA